LPPATIQIHDVGFDAWSPDGQHVLVRTTTAKTPQGIAVFDLGAAESAAVAYREGYWTSGTSFAGFGPSTADSVIGHVRFFGLSGTQTGEVPANFEAVRFAPGSTVFVGIIPGGSDSAIGTTYRVWNGSGLSKARQGIPLAWTADASRLAVLMSLQGGGHGGSGRDGTLAVVDANGAIQFELPGWIGDAYGVATFSPDGSYLAACLAAADGSDPPQVRVIDVRAKSISSSAGQCGIASWSAGNSLLTSDGSPTLWTPTTGATDAGLGDQTFATISSDGKIASWSGATVRVTDGQSETEYRMADVVDGGVAWSPDGSAIVVGSAGTLFLIPVAAD
jgi:WD40 repeat protein